MTVEADEEVETDGTDESIDDEEIKTVDSMADEVSNKELEKMEESDEALERIYDVWLKYPEVPITEDVDEVRSEVWVEADGIMLWLDMVADKVELESSIDECSTDEEKDEDSSPVDEANDKSLEKTIDELTETDEDTGDDKYEESEEYEFEDKAEDEAEDVLAAVVVASPILQTAVVVVEVKYDSESWLEYLSAQTDEIESKTPLPFLPTALTFGAGRSMVSSFK